MVDTYIDINLPVPDAMAASKLCGPDGPCKYVIRSSHRSIITKHWLTQQLCLQSTKMFGEAMAEVLSLPLLWAAFEDYRVERADENANYVPILHRSVKENVMEVYCREYGALPTVFVNPVCKVPILPQGYGAQLHMIELSDGSDPPETEQTQGAIPGTEGAAAPAGGAPPPQQSLQQPEAAAAIMSQQVQVQRRVEENALDIKNELTRIAHSFSRQFHNIHNSIKRIALPVSRPRAAAITNILLENISNRDEILRNLEDGGVDSDLFTNVRAKLYRGVKNLYDLWHEYEFGLSGNKPAKYFTSQERGKCRFIYCRRKVFWDVVKSFINTVQSSDTAIGVTIKFKGFYPLLILLSKKVSLKKQSFN